MRAYSAEASAATSAARFGSPMMVHAVLDHGLAEFRQRAVAALLDRHVDDHRARLHRRAPSLRAISTGALRPGISAVVMMMSASLARSCTSSAWRAHPVGRHRPRVAADALGDLALFVGDEGHVDELGAQRFDLFLDRRAHVGRFDHGAQALGGGDRLQAGHADAHDQHARRLDGAGGRHQHRHEALIGVGGHHHGLVAGDVGLRGQHVHRLRALFCWCRFNRYRIAKRDGGFTNFIVDPTRAG